LAGFGGEITHFLRNNKENWKNIWRIDRKTLLLSSEKAKT
jgi:hypothetical protein